MKMGTLLRERGAGPAVAERVGQRRRSGSGIRRERPCRLRGRLAALRVSSGEISRTRTTTHAEAFVKLITNTLTVCVE